MGDLPQGRIPIRRERLGVDETTRLFGAVSSRTLARLGWLLTCALIVYKSLGEWQFYRPGIWAPTLVVPADVAGNTFVYIIFGGLATLSASDTRPRHWVRRALKVSLIAVLFSATNEALQLYTIDRVASLTDIVSAAIGAFAGGAIAAWRVPK